MPLYSTPPPKNTPPKKKQVKPDWQRGFYCKWQVLYVYISLKGIATMRQETLRGTNGLQIWKNWVSTRCQKKYHRL